MKHGMTTLSTYAFLLLAILCWLYTPAYGGSADYWPTEGWRTSTPEQQGIDSALLADMLETIMEMKYTIDSITVIRNGYIVMDAYFYPYRKGEKHILKSCTKSITGALVGIAIDKGHIKNVEQKIRAAHLRFTRQKHGSCVYCSVARFPELYSGIITSLLY